MKGTYFTFDFFFAQTHNGKFAAEAMISNEGEVVEFLKQVYLEGAVEYYLREIGKSPPPLPLHTQYHLCALVVQRL